MALTPEQLRELHALRFRALGDATRIRLLEILAELGERSVTELMEATGLGQSLVSHHLRTLRQAGLVTIRREGRWMNYDLNAAGLGAVEQVVGSLRAGESND